MPHRPLPLGAPKRPGVTVARAKVCMTPLRTADVERAVIVSVRSAAQAAANPGATFIPTWKLFENAAGQYSTYLTIGGGLVQVRDPDEVHIDPPGGTNLLGAFVIGRLQAAWHITL